MEVRSKGDVFYGMRDSRSSGTSQGSWSGCKRAAPSRSPRQWSFLQLRHPQHSSVPQLWYPWNATTPCAVSSLFLESCSWVAPLSQGPHHFRARAVVSLSAFGGFGKLLLRQGRRRERLKMGVKEVKGNAKITHTKDNDNCDFPCCSQMASARSVSRHGQPRVMKDESSMRLDLSSKLGFQMWMCNTHELSRKGIA